MSVPPFGRRWAFFLDIDGTLLDIAETPDAVESDTPKNVLIESLHRAAGGALALVSGRPIAGIDALFAPLKLPTAGLHGIERRAASGRIQRQAVDAAPLRRAAAGIRQFAASHRGLVLEDKGSCIALHYRLAPQLRDAVHEVVLAAAARLGCGFEAQNGKMVIELKPVGRDKGTAVGEFMAEAPFAGRTAVYLGDDLTDEHAFQVVNRLGGHSIKVGEGETLARWRIGDACAVRAWLEQWLEKFGRS